MDRLKQLEQEIFKLKDTLKTKEKQLCEIKQNSKSVNMNKRKSYSKDDLEKALEAIKEGFSVKSTAKKFGIPRATLHFRLSGKFVKSSFGPRPILSGEDETTLVGWIEHCSNIGFPKSKGDILQSIKEFITINNIKTPFKDNCPGDGWYKAFLRRHPSIAELMSEAVTKASACISEGHVRGWFKQVEVVLEEEELSQVLQQPERIFIADESRFLLNPNLKSKVLSKKVYEIDPGDAKSSLTVLFSFSAVGAVSPPMIIYPYKRIPASIIETVPKEWGIGRSDTGWIKSELFFEYISNVFHPWLIKSNIPLPVVLFVDGHKSHITFHLSELCTELKITLIALYPNATRILQQADVSAFKPFKNGWKKGLTEWRLQNPEKDFTKIDFAPVLKIMLTNCINKNILINGFRVCGLYPWNPNNIDFTKCLDQSTSTVEPEPSSEVISFDVTSPNQLMNFDDFINIVGEDIADNLDKTSESSLDEKGRLLKKIYSFFKSEEGSLNKSIENILSSINLPEAMITPTTVVDVVKPSTSYQSTPVKRSQRKRKVFESSDIIKSPLAEVLQWPDLPKKKYKGNIQRLQIDVTSQKRKLMMEANVLKKTKALEIKESKKLERENKNQNKPKKQGANVETKKPSLCFKCGNTLKSNFLSCAMCSKTFHEKCLKRYDFPESGDSDDFICPKVSGNNNGIDAETTKVKIGKLPKWAIERYSRQILLPDIGVEGQAKLMSARVLVVGAGGLGCPAAVYLAGAGVGEIGIVDYDEVDVTNIHRQILHSESDQDLSKAESAANSLRSINSKIKITAYNTELSPANAVRIASNYDVILDCTDNVPTRYMLNDLSILTKIPLISGSALKMEGQLTIYGYRKHKNETTAGPCYRCVFPRPPPAAAVGSCSAQGVAGPVPGAIGSLQALEAIKLIVGKTKEELLVGRMLIFDGEDMTFRTVKLRPKNSKCEMCSDVATIKELTNYEVLCKMQSKEKDLDLHILPQTHRISATELSNSCLNKRHLLIDVRSEAEYTMCHIDDAVNFPLDQLHGDRFRDLLDIISKCSNDVIFICRRGNDSQVAAQMVLNEQDKVVKDVSGGLHAWARDVDRDFPVY